MNKSFFRHYQREMKVVGAVAILVVAIRLIIVHHQFVAQNLFTEKAMMILLGLAIAGVAAQAIRLYYRVIIIKYTLLLALFFIAFSCHSGSGAVASRDTLATRAFSKPKADLRKLAFGYAKDPYCGMPLRSGVEDSLTYHGKLYGFCSRECKDEFLKDPAGNVAKLK